MSTHNLLVLSDVHLGSDLVHCVRPEAPNRDGICDDRDRQLSSLFDWYRDHPERGLPWRLVIAGDFVDFVGMSIAPPSQDLPTPPNDEDRMLGLGGAEDHTIYKLRCVARRHAAIFRSLASFVAAGNCIVVVRGNHDVDFHWPAVQAEFVAQLSVHARVPRQSVKFAPWFYYEENVVFIEHGHQYDRYCSYENLLVPLSPSDPRRSSRSMSDILLRHVVRPTRGLVETGHERSGVLDYIGFGLKLGVRGTAQLFTRFVGAVVTLFAMWSERFSEGSRRLRGLHERRMEELARALDVQIDKLRALARLHRPPVTRHFGQLAVGVMLDRIFFTIAGVMFIALTFALAPVHAFLISTGITLSLVSLAAVFSRLRPIDPTSELRASASLVAGLFPAAFVVMGHTHFPEVLPKVRGSSTYVNLGCWAEGEGGKLEGGVAASRTHLVVRFDDAGQSMAELLIWDADEGPRRFTAAVPQVPVEHA